jgi:hypothetical protein
MSLIFFYLFIGVSCSNSEFYFKSFEVKLAENFYNPLLPIVVIDNINEIFENATSSTSSFKIKALKNKNNKSTSINKL